MKDGHCIKRYPKQFLDETRQGTDSYPEYRRRVDESVSLGKDRSIDNRWVVPYNPWLLLKYDYHINVDICSSIKSIKYLYKYVYKGPDRVAMEVHKGPYMDEVQQYVDARWICPTSWEYLLTNNGMTFSTFKKSVKDRGFLETGHSIHDCLVEAMSLRMPYALRRLLVTILIFCEPTDVRGLWKEFFTHMVEDYQTANNVVESDLTNMLFKDLNELLNLHGKKIEDYDLPYLPPNTIDRGAVPSIIQEELAVDVPNEDIEFVAKLNNDQMIAFNTIMNVIVQKHSGVFFVDGPGGTDDMVRLPLHIAIPWEGEHSIQVLIQHSFPNLELHGWDAPCMVQRAILTPINDDVQKLNDMIIDQFPGEEHNLLSFDEVEGDNHNLYQQEFLNSIAQGSLPPHILKIKKGAPLMLLRNLDPRYGLCNGTRLLCRGLFMNMLDVEILTGSNAGKHFFCP
ncbi:hypothetical protein KIW84_046347 [Lathyrus oleraceus]|uniref:DNA helicase Pif1-like 2B domain-containing protein n=1 Tax=Pisum sativum TaxID=3888 RepID=A0A9D5AYH2_PEA|nr:hypothetical protein KIW84_046347 [Pisum sativum]